MNALPALFAGYTALSVAGLLLLRANLHRAATGIRGGAGDKASIALVELGVVLYIAGFALWLLILSRLPVSRAYPLAIGLTLSATTLGAHWVLGEALSAWQYVGAALVFAGIALLAQGKTA